MTARPSRPQHLPEYRNAIADNDDLWGALGMLDAYTGKKDFEHAQHIREELAHAQLWWVGADAVDLIEQAAPSMPPATLTEDFRPDECGFVFFERPMESGHDADHPEVTIRVDAISWFPTILGDQDRPCLSFVSWQHVETIPLALGRADWPYGFDTDQRIDIDTMTDAAHVSIVEDRRLLAALWQLSSQPGLTESIDQPPDRPTAKRLTRARKPVPNVRLVNLAPHRRGPRDGDSGASQREYTRRWIVEGHWRQQACGPGWQDHRPVYIAPYVKGPDDKPLVVNETVKVWRG